MPLIAQKHRQGVLFAASWTLGIAFAATAAQAATVVLKNGTQLTGVPGKIASISEAPNTQKPSTANVDNSLVMFVDDDLRRTFFSYYAVETVNTAAEAPQERIKFDKRVSQGPKRVASVGPLRRVTEFDKYGNRYVTMATGGGEINVIHGITEITPVYTRVQGLLTQPKYSHMWDMRLSTNSLSRETLTPIIMQQIDNKSADQRLQVVRLYMQADRYRDAEKELDLALQDFPELADLNSLLKRLHQLSATRLVEEIELRRDAGQHALSENMLQSFPEEEVASETLLRVQEILEEMQKRKAQIEQVSGLLEQHFQLIKSSDLRLQLAPILQEIRTELNPNTLDRMADYLRLASDASMSAEQKVALAITGWLMGSGAGEENIAVAVSLHDGRDAAKQYLSTDWPNEREAVIEKLRGTEGVSPANLAKLLRNMKPPLELAGEQGPSPGLLKLTTDGLVGEPSIQYYLQLPPEYDPYRRYPCIVTLNSSSVSEVQQIDWWAGAYDENMNMRLGQASRHGYIVIAPRWRQPHQTQYGYSAGEHAAVLYSLQDACRRLSIDTDRVYLTGHSMGGDAAWDIGLAHPDLWAGVIPVSARGDKYITRYWKNARYVPMYFVCGEMDGDIVSRNGIQWDRYFTRVGFDVMVAAYKGRGHEHFHDEIQRLFAWMDGHRRDFWPREFECVSMRRWDRFYWWVEVDGFPERSMVAPLNWPQSGAKEAITEARVLETNGISVSTAADQATVWLTPDMVDFDDPLTIVINRRRRRETVQPDIEAMLEDVRTRADRANPFWAKVQ